MHGKKFKTRFIRVGFHFSKTERMMMNMHWIKRWFKQMFCRHSWAYHTSFTKDGVEEDYKICVKCFKRKDMEENK